MKKDFFGLQHGPSGQLLRIVESHEGAYELTLDPNCPLFEVDSVEALSRVLFDDIPHYNSSPEVPSWGPFTEAELTPVAIRIETTVTPCLVPDVVKLHVVSARDTHLKVASIYAGRTLVPVTPDKRFVLWLVTLQDGQTLESVKAFEGQVVHGRDRWSKRHLYWAGPVPEELQLDLKGKPGLLAVVSGML